MVPWNNIIRHTMLFNGHTNYLIFFEVEYNFMIYSYVHLLLYRLSFY